MNDKLCKTVLRFRSHICNQAARIRVKLTEGLTTWANIRGEGKIVHVVFKHLYKSMYHANTIITIKGLVTWFLFFCIFYSAYIHSITFIQDIHPSPFAKVPVFSSLLSSVEKTSLGCRAENQTRAATMHLLTELPHILSELRPTLLSYAAPLLSYAAPLLSYAAPLLSYAAPLLIYAAPLLNYAAIIRSPSTLHYLISQTPIISHCINAA